MKDKCLQIIDWYDQRKIYFTSIACFLYVFLTILSWCLMFKLSNSIFNDICVDIISIIRKGVFIIFFLTIFNGLFKKTLDWKLTTIFAVISGLSYWFSKNPEVIKMFFSITALSCLPFKWTLNDYYRAQKWILLLVITLASFGIIENALYDKERMRFGLGFDSSSTSAVILFHIMIIYGCLKRKPWNKTNLYLFILSSVLIFIATNSRFIFGMSMVYLIISYFLLKKIDFKLISTSWMRRFIVALPFILAVLSFLIFISYNSNNTIWQSLDRIFSERFSLTHDAIFKYGLTLFGRPIVWSGNNYFNLPVAYNYVDNSYIKYLLEFGLLWFLFYLLLFGFGLYRIIKTKNASYFLSLIVLLILGCIESFLFTNVFNPFMIYGYIQLNSWFCNKEWKRSF